jgi:hypothetical protein
MMPSCIINASLTSTLLTVLLVLPALLMDTVELIFVSLQGVDVAATDKDKIRPLLDAFAAALWRSLSLHHVMPSTHRIAHRTGEGLVGLSGGRNGRQNDGKE